MVSVLVSKLAGLFLKIPLANLLGGTGMGYYSSAYAVFMPLYALCAASLPPAVAQTVSESAAYNRYGRIRLTKKTALWFFGSVSLVLTLLPLIFSEFIAERIIGNPDARLSVMAISPCIFLGTVTAVYRGYYEGLRNMTPTAVSQMADSIVKLIFGLGLAYVTKEYAYGCYYTGAPVFGQICLNEYDAANASLPYISAAAVVGTAVADLAGMLYLILHHKLIGDGIQTAELPSGSESGKILKHLLYMIAPIALASVVSSLINTIDLSTIILLIKNSLRNHPELYSERYASIIASGVKLSELPNFLYGSFTGLSMAIFTLAPSLCAVFGKSAFPNIAESYAKKDMPSVSKEIRRALMTSAYISIPAGFGLCVFSEPVLKLLFSSRYAEISVSHLPLSVLSLSTAFLAISSAAYSMLQAINRSDLPVKITVVGAIVKLGLNSVLIPINQSGLVGAAAATAISYMVMAIWSVAALYKLTNTRPKIGFSVILPSIGGILSSLSSAAVYSYLQNSLSNTISVTISVLFAVIIYILFVTLLDISTKNAISAQIFG